VEQIEFDERGLVPAIVQDEDGTVLMLAYMNKESLEATIRSGQSHFWSRKRKRLWRKGEESGNVQDVKAILYDCDHDTLLLKVKQKGVACHTGNRTCFFRLLWGEDVVSSSIIDEVFGVIQERKKERRPGSYTSSLFEKGREALVEKLKEEADEFCKALREEGKESVINEASDLIFHILCALLDAGVHIKEVYKELKRRRK
jgi:phosphoribosyl-ATP pyrophosphohydrolase/phosphoribosyl-AMP cyclohydrolase